MPRKAGWLLGFGRWHGPPGWDWRWSLTASTAPSFWGVCWAKENGTDLSLPAGPRTGIASLVTSGIAIEGTALPARERGDALLQAGVPQGDVQQGYYTVNLSRYKCNPSLSGCLSISPGTLPARCHGRRVGYWVSGGGMGLRAGTGGGGREHTGAGRMPDGLPGPWASTLWGCWPRGHCWSPYPPGTSRHFWRRLEREGIEGVGDRPDDGPGGGVADDRLPGRSPAARVPPG